MKYLVLYAKVVDDKEFGMIMNSINFGGIADTVEEADSVAKQCVSSVQGCTVITKIYPFQDGKLKEAVKSMHVLFDRLADEIYRNEGIAARQA